MMYSFKAAAVLALAMMSFGADARSLQNTVTGTFGGTEAVSSSTCIIGAGSASLSDSSAFVKEYNFHANYGQSDFCLVDKTGINLNRVLLERTCDAMAVSYAKVAAKCTTRGTAVACASASTSTEKMTSATVQAMVTLFSQGRCGNCAFSQIDSAAIAEKVNLATAASAFTDFCTSSAGGTSTAYCVAEAKAVAKAYFDIFVTVFSKIAAGGIGGDCLLIQEGLVKLVADAKYTLTTYATAAPSADLNGSCASDATATVKKKEACVPESVWHNLGFTPASKAPADLVKVAATCAKSKAVTCCKSTACRTNSVGCPCLATAMAAPCNWVKVNPSPSWSLNSRCSAAQQPSYYKPCLGTPDLEDESVASAP